MRAVEFLDVMSRGLTPVYNRGMERLELGFGDKAGDGSTSVAAYDFQAYADLYGGLLPDSPRYLLTPGFTTADPLTVRVWFKSGPNAAEAPADVAIPAGWSAGRGVAIPIPGPASGITSQLRLTRFQPQLPASPNAADWGITVLLGNLAKLLWVVGWEYEELAAQMVDVAAQRNAAAAHGFSLDLLGRDLGVPRFPPTPYTWDPDTVALYHFDDLPPTPQSPVPMLSDERSRYQPTGGHPGQLVVGGVSAEPGHSAQPGRFSQAFRFEVPQSYVLIKDHTDFALPAGSSFTVEAIIKPDRAVTATGAVIAKRVTLNTVGDPGWALTIGSFRGFDRNLRLSLSDGAQEVDLELFCDADLGDGIFHHVAGVVERRAGPPAVTLARLYLDGVEVARQTLDTLGALSNSEPIRIGYGLELATAAPTDAQFVGLVDEVRISAVARDTFNPVVGEGDDRYRRRLRVFQRWVLPTPDAIQAAINELAGPVANDPHPFIVDETVQPTVIGTLPLRVLPARLQPGQGVSSDGDLRSTEAQAVGSAADDDFDPAWLRRHPDQAHLSFNGTDSNRMMQRVVSQALDALLDRIAGVSGTLTVLGAYDPSATDLRRVGRALLLIHDHISPGDLAVHAHAAGFGWARNLGTGQARVAQPVGEVFSITPLPTGQDPQPPDVVEGNDLNLGVDPDILSPGSSRVADAQGSWSLVRCGFGDATLAVSPRPKLHALAAGNVSVHLEVIRKQHTAGGSRRIRIGLADTSLAAGQTIGGDGRRNVTEADAAGAPSPDFDELYLQTTSFDNLSTAVSYGAAPGNRRMQRGAADALSRLIKLLSATPGTLSVVKAYDPAGIGLIKQGRALWLSHSSLSASALAARAFAAGFDYLRIEPGPPQIVQAAVAAGELIGVHGVREVQVGTSIPIAVEPQAAPIGVCFSSDGARAYVAEQSSSRISSFTLTASPANAFPQIVADSSAAVLPDPVAIAVAGGHLYVVHRELGVIAVLDPTTLATATSFAAGARPITLAADGDRLFVGCAGTTVPTSITLGAYDTQSNGQVGSLVLPAIPTCIAPIPGGTALYVATVDNRICQVNRANLTLTGAPFATGAKPSSAVVTPDGKKLYVACAADDPGNQSGTIRAYTTGNNTQVAVITGFPRQTQPVRLTVAADQKYLYVATVGQTADQTGRVHVVDLATDTLKPQIFNPGGTSSALAVSPSSAPYQTCLLAASADAGTITLGDPDPLAGVPPRPPRVAYSLVLGAGGGEQLSWSTVPLSRGRVELASLVRPHTRVRGLAPGAALIRASYLRGDGNLPYQFAVRLNPSLEGQARVTIRKDQYDLVMNVLNWFHPIGVEVRTDRLRTHVVELAELGDLFPGYTFPVFRNPGVLQPGPPIRPRED
ncbi:LamG-like jellyroll fold domain-containing protein [Mycobacterium sp.]|uniref:LamG-like jellyroll fold domain-containing protein n=1 Tax=Mycobacterium sp. TaxID=1785 RepID=UPI003D1174D1